MENAAVPVVTAGTPATTTVFNGLAVWSTLKFKLSDGSKTPAGRMNT